MHTSLLKFDHFAAEADGVSVGVEELFPTWHKHSRFGIVIQEPLGAVGASLLTQAAVATYFKHLPESWPDTSEGELYGPPWPGTYPEIYAFHIGRRQGVLGVVDFWPPYKEVLVEDDPVSVLHAVNGRGITVLAVPEGEERDHHFVWPEVRALLWRTEAVFSYSPSGQVPDADVSIRSTDQEPETNTAGMLDPQWRIAPLRDTNPERTRLEYEGMVLEGTLLDDALRFVADCDARRFEVSAEDHAAAAALREAIVTDGHATETYRRRDGEYALRRLVA